MKSLTAVCQTGAAAMPAINANGGRISRHPHQRGDGENAEMKMYLSKLKDLVPFMPKNRKLSKLEIIQHVIDYICDLQTELETHPDVNNFNAASALNNYATVAEFAQNLNVEQEQEEQEQLQLHLNQQQHHHHHHHHQQQQQQQQHQQQQMQQSSLSTPTRQPLVDRQTPNTILPMPEAQYTFATTLNNLVSTQQQQHVSTTSTTTTTASTSTATNSAVTMNI